MNKHLRPTSNNHLVDFAPKYLTVEIKLTKERKSMNNFKIGDQEVVDINNHNQRIYELVYSFIHASPNRLYDYLKISVENISE
ncbi:unnamed protein product [Rotaria sordida]|uniref:Uncharacterized protein n=1 Tax=Rotaria sordida TaxID=392033 RepID=A0A818K826_9BILA|nr:unnamed protein product [Rotaria sordida]CAF1367085.1 unnamed protein product [Rotaria sordida]CAF3557356.1 unnamed protein product [Rotaria sordida]CAF3830276.1 unnamed protein product [Rotaria sordida]